MRKTTWVPGVVAAVAVLTGCGGVEGADDARSSPLAVTATVTETVTVTPDATPVPLEPASLDAAPPQLEIEVYEDGCGVIRSEAERGVTYDNLTWSVRDRAGFQVLGRVAENETRYRYFVPGRFTVVLEAFWGGAYHRVSNEVSIRC